MWLQLQLCQHTGMPAGLEGKQKQSLSHVRLGCSFAFAGNKEVLPLREMLHLGPEMSQGSSSESTMINWNES